MNYRYKVANEDIILSPEEHAKVLDARQKGAKELVLRNGTLGLNLAYFQFFKKTNQLTTDQEKGAEEILKLEDKKYNDFEPTPFYKALQKGKKELYEKMGWN